MKLIAALLAGRAWIDDKHLLYVEEAAWREMHVGRFPANAQGYVAGFVDVTPLELDGDPILTFDTTDIGGQVVGSSGSMIVRPTPSEIGPHDFLRVPFVIEWRAIVPTIGTYFSRITGDIDCGEWSMPFSVVPLD